MHYSFASILAAALLTTASPLSVNTRHGLPIVETTTLANGHVIDWVRPDATAQPPRANGELPSIATPLNGPEGAVPYLRAGPNPKPKKSPPPKAGLDKRQSIPSGHKYAFTQQTVNNIGGGATFSLYDPYLESKNDFSLIQTAVAHDGVENAKYGSVTQTLEAGWQKYPAFSPSAVHMFTFYNTNGYNAVGDNQGGYNTDQKGWVQVDKNIYPGYAFRPLSVDGGAQHDVALEYQLYQGNWWLTVNGTYIGYYPASLFSASPNSGSTLATVSNEISFYGEMYSDNSKTTSDMGSGEFPSAGQTKSAYMRNIVWLDSNNQNNNYNAPASNNIVTDPNSYQLQTHFNSGGSWGSYMLLGGPGYGGKVGG